MRLGFRSAWLCMLLARLAMSPAEAGAGGHDAAGMARARILVTVTPAASGAQVVRTALPLPRRMLEEGETLVAHEGRRKVEVALRALTWHPRATGHSRSVRRAMVTVPYQFKNDEPVTLAFSAAPTPPRAAAQLPVEVKVAGDAVRVAYRGGPVLTAKLLAPARSGPSRQRAMTVESNAFFLWKRIHLPDQNWPRVIEVRADALGNVALVAHLQRRAEGNGRAPDFGWEVETTAPACSLREGAKETAAGAEGATHRFANGEPCVLTCKGDRYRIYHPAAPFNRRGFVEAKQAEGGPLRYRYLRCTADEKVPMQQAAWRRAEMVIAPAGLAALKPTLEYPHEVKVDWPLWDALYRTGKPLDLKNEPALAGILRYHRNAIVRSATLGDDWGNVTAYNDGLRTGPPYGMNRLNHCAAIFEEAYRSGDQRLLDVAVAWCDNFYDQSIWWGPGETGGTRYNNIIAMGETPPDNDQSYMWRSNSAVHFCTKGFDAFFMAYEQTGDPRMLEALKAQVAYASKHVFVDLGECRNVGVARDFVRLYECTGERRYLGQALRLFRELRSKLSAGALFSQGGEPIEPDPPFIEDDKGGYGHPFAKPYIIGYALQGLPLLLRHSPDEPRLREVVQAVADFLADSQDPVGGWRYPHPRSSGLILNQAPEHAWQIAQADLALGAQEKHLEVIERVLRQRVQAWLKTGFMLGGVNGWELSTGKVKDNKELYDLYKRPSERDAERDYAEGTVGLGYAAPEGVVHFPEVLAFYLEHRAAGRLLAPASPDEPLGKVLARVKGR